MIVIIIFITILVSGIADSATLETITTGPLFQVHVVKGGRAEMPCDVVTADPTDRVILVLWYKDGIGAPIYTYDSRDESVSEVRNWADEKTLGDRGHFDLKASPSALVLDDVGPADEGLYRCRVDFKNSPTRNARTNLTVLIPPNTPTILTERNGQQVWTMVGPYNEGESMTLTCEVNGGKPAPQVTWWMDNELVDDTSESSGPRKVTNTLTIRRLTRRHLHASLVCQAANTNYSAPVQTTITIEMNFKPLAVKILGSREPLSAGREYELVCQSIGARPSASLTWWLDGIQLTNATTSTASSGNVTLSTLTLIPNDADGGKFLKCLAESPVIDHQALQDKWQLEVYYTPQVYLAMGSNLSPDEIKEGDDAYFECNVRAHPWVYKVVWHHNGVQVQHNVSAGVIVSNQSLVIQRVKRQQTGLYICVASNIEGDGQSNAVVLRVQYAPVCASGQTHVYGAARNEEVSVTCRLDAVPPAVHFSWRFNSSGDVVDIAESHVATRGLQSSLSYVARTELDYGTLLCWGRNALGRQRAPCLYRVVPAGPPDPPENCSVANRTAEALRVRCAPGYDGGLPQAFVVEAFGGDSGRLLLNVTEASAPDFTLAGLEAGASYLLRVYAANAKGASERRPVSAYTLRDVAERRTAQVRPPPEELAPVAPILAVVVGVVGSLVLVGVVAVVVVGLKRRGRRGPGGKGAALPVQTSLADSARDLDDKNPDLIPSAGGGEGESRSPTTPEEGGFGSVHICASVPYPSNVYGTYPRNPRAVAPSNPQNGELMYAELSFPRGVVARFPPPPPPPSGAPSGGVGLRRPEPTIYAQIDHRTPPMGVMGGGDLALLAPAPPPLEFGGRPSPPVVLLLQEGGRGRGGGREEEDEEEEEQRRPLMNDPKESEV